MVPVHMLLEDACGAAICHALGCLGWRCPGACCWHFCAVMVPKEAILHRSANSTEPLQMTQDTLWCL
jgi:hypothetical protein